MNEPYLTSIYCGLHMVPREPLQVAFCMHLQLARLMKILSTFKSMALQITHVSTACLLTVQPAI